MIFDLQDNRTMADGMEEEEEEDLFAEYGEDVAEKEEGEGEKLQNEFVGIAHEDWSESENECENECEAIFENWSETEDECGSLYWSENDGKCETVCETVFEDWSETEDECGNLYWSESEDGDECETLIGDKVNAYFEDVSDAEFEFEDVSDKNETGISELGEVSDFEMGFEDGSNNLDSKLDILDKSNELIEGFMDVGETVGKINVEDFRDNLLEELKVPE